MPSDKFRCLLFLAWAAVFATPINASLARSAQNEQDTGYSAVVIGVSDGDTIKVIHDGKVERIRLGAIDAPEKKQPFGVEAREYVTAHCWRKRVFIQPHGCDRWGRTIAEVDTASGDSLNLLLVSTGLAWWYRTYAPDDIEMMESEQQARDLHLGLWKQAHPMPPWEFRRSELQKRISKVAFRHAKIF